MFNSIPISCNQAKYFPRGRPMQARARRVLFANVIGPPLFCSPWCSGCLFSSPPLSSHPPFHLFQCSPSLPISFLTSSPVPPLPSRRSQRGLLLWFHISFSSLPLQPLDIDYKIHYHLYILIMQMRIAQLACWRLQGRKQELHCGWLQFIRSSRFNCNKLITLFPFSLNNAKKKREQW